MDTHLNELPSLPPAKIAILGGTFLGQHIATPLQGVAVHINAFNFPIWGMLEKAAVNWLAGMPCIIKPAEQTCYLTEVMVKEIIQSEELIILELASAERITELLLRVIGVLIIDIWLCCL